MADRGVLEFNGTAFESEIARMIKAKFTDAVVLSDIQVYSEFLGKNTQIDLMMLHPRGIFVLEAKGWRKWVQGGYSDKMWRGISSQTNVMTVPNPVYQNVIHIRALRNAIRNRLCYNPVSFYNLVVFPDNTELRTDCREVVNLALLRIAIEQRILLQRYLVDVHQYRSMILQVAEEKI